jgi:hypothetical protein
MHESAVSGAWSAAQNGEHLLLLRLVGEADGEVEVAALNAAHAERNA